ncbi:glycerophosphodiester phosphodiesterase [Cohnella ginsengisoli]|uniref:Glycerophosphodiester phosphodiesterase n=1 Tax=Cohnella ginsengisoli TaxID=425004 RepID=A0A9X4KIU4_9BACL|nr:glycerophosphodiester phosphodiesterase [Cohnella ginsengisoli]MDG0792616.1 glycerophosphodiester phosphodiesterase [Cohnella ginsengisoli]
MGKRTLIIGHRGAAGEAPENTLASFRTAVTQGADAVELDIHLSADGEIVVCHDPTVDRTTDGAGSIALLTVAELKGLDAGSWFDPRYASEKLPLLEEVLALVPAGIMINIEVKCRYSIRLEKRLRQLLATYRRQDGVVVSSFDHKALARLKQAAPSLRIGLLYAADFRRHSLIATSFGSEVYSLHPDHRWLGDEDIADAMRAGLRVYPYTVNGKAEWDALIAAEVSGIITDYPGRLRAVRDRAL